MSNIKPSLNFKKIVICHFNFVIHLLFVILILSLFPTPAFAQTPVPSYVPPTSPVYTDLLVHNLFHTFSCLSVGSSVIGQPCLTYQKGIPVLSQVNLQGGALGATTSIIGALYLNPPVRTGDYLASVGQGLGIVKEAKAQVIGSGAQVLSPILTLWQVSRNIAYVFMIIIFVVIGLMVMFRNRINPQTVITAQAALPGLVIGLIMITFSYFLAGLISDMAFVGTNVVGYYFSIAQRPNAQPQILVDKIQGQNILGLFTPFTKAISSSSVADALNSIWDHLADPNTCRFCPWDLDPQKVLTTLAAFVVSQIVMPFGGMFGGPGQIVAGIISFGGTALAPIEVASLALSFAAMAILIYAMFRLLLRLINNYLTIIFLTIIAPFHFLASALPGRQGLATNWILNMLANILAFPAVLAVLYFVAYILGPGFVQPPQSEVFQITQLNQAEPNNLTPVAQAAEGRIVNKSTFPLFGGLDFSFINLLLAFGALVALPAIPDIIARTVGRIGVAGQLIGQELGGSYGAGRGYAGQISQGTSGLAGQVGRITDEPGLFFDPTTKQWRQPRTPGEMLSAGTKSGQLRRTTRGRFGF
ncbi:hypothetical protein HYU96_04445 [Candidatus Daviesbacteria bacterium]|nr:hypothetical protein [Candidatus Daviesbacteria bacterium]